MIEAVEEAYPMLHEEELHNTISGLFIASQGLGETLGPVLGSTLDHLYGFRTSQDIIACSLLVFMVLYFLFCGNFTMFRSECCTPTTLVHTP